MDILNFYLEESYAERIYGLEVILKKIESGKAIDINEIKKKIDYYIKTVDNGSKNLERIKDDKRRNDLGKKINKARIILNKLKHKDIKNGNSR